MIMAELNNLEFWAMDIGNAYLEALAAERYTLLPVQNLANWTVMPWS
jgi:hypothetical protein